MTDREPCVRCGEKVPLDARACPYCDRSALVDLLVDQPVTDGRKRFRLARAIAALGREAPPTADIQQALLRKDGVVAAGVTRAFAAQAFQALAAEDVKSSLALSAGVTGFSLPWRPVAAALALVALGAFGVVNWRRSKAPAPAPSAAPVPAAAAAPLPAPAARATSLSTKELAARCLPSTVSIRCADSVGSGFFVTDELVLTNEHVVCPGGGAIEVVRSDGQKQTGAAVQSDGRLDLALVRVAGAHATPLPLGDVSDLVVGEQVMVIGSPMGLEFTVHPGIVSNMSRTLFGLSYLQIDAQVNPGNSGGPVLNDRGQVVGVVSLKHMGAEGIGLALPVNYAWSGQSPLIPAPASASSSAFAGMQAKADEQNREMRDAFAAAQAMPALLGGYVDQYRRLVVRIGRLGTSPPGFETFTVKLMRGREELCTMKGDVSEWKALQGKPDLDPRLRSWMEGNQLDRRVFMGDAPIRIDQCPAQRSLVGLELVLVGGNPEVSRVVIG